MIVIAMRTAAMSQPTAIHRPPSKIHSMFRNSDITDMVRLLGALSPDRVQ
jgi:hypothetical protein